MNVRAQRDVDRALAWWRENRPGAGASLEAELAEKLAALQAHPYLGRLVYRHRTPVRRLALRSGHLLHYRVRPRLREIEVVRFDARRINR